MGDVAKAFLPSRSCTVYQRRRPEQTVLYRVIQQHLLTFYAEVEGQSAEGYSLPRYVKEEFEGYLKCGLPQHGFARIKCKSPDCGHEHLVAYSCKSRAICPSCTARRMADVAAHLCDHVLPDIGYRQWTLSFPKYIRFRLAHNSHLLSKVLKVFHRTVVSWQKRQAKRCGIKQPLPSKTRFLRSGVPAAVRLTGSAEYSPTLVVSRRGVLSERR